jgi:hypothetical protein
MHRLVTSIRSIQLRRGSGLLIAKRGEGANMEEGSIIFVNGQVTEAKIGRRTGSEAFNRLSTWENCQFSFILRRSAQEKSLYFTDVDAMELLSPIVASDKHSNTQSLLEGNERGSERPPYYSQVTSTQGDLYTDGTGVPQSSKTLSDVLQMIEQQGLSRTHRRLFLLIDGIRSVNELVPLIGRTPDEVLELLHDLEFAHVLFMPNGSS